MTARKNALAHPRPFFCSTSILSRSGGEGVDEDVEDADFGLFSGDVAAGFALFAKEGFALGNGICKRLGEMLGIGVGQEGGFGELEFVEEVEEAEGAWDLFDGHFV